MRKAFETLPLLGLMAFISLAGNFLGYRITPLAALPGVLALLLISFFGIVIAQIVRIKAVPAIVYISLLGVLLTSPFSPLAPVLSSCVDKVNFLALATPVLACAGIGLASEMAHLRKYGLKLLVVAIFVFSGTFLGSALVAELLIRLTNQSFR